ncbi:hypothetical protein [Ancylobacter defluvii]|uniref:Uncharacterized protein n=1 Tax=Ancylobacter defluvii TaxID=1282440 RepID=A0A9W6JRK6_9HYPH|nr:hypothetical protein [Ancylobacter defluvii]MBS7587662.1 hypothetical protein [Ancylobacter defluvii]GLK82471.1 hypothetical protein GCM10017653_05400 [Ancylobacter defluvii]
MVFLLLELWPYVLGAAAIGLLTGWFCGCAPHRSRTLAEVEAPDTSLEAKP